MPKQCLRIIRVGCERIWSGAQLSVSSSSWALAGSSSEAPSLSWVRLPDGPDELSVRQPPLVLWRVQARPWAWGAWCT